MKGKARCRMHGGAKGSGTPRGERNGAYRHGGHSVEAVAFRRQCRAVLREAREGLEELPG